MRSKWGWPLIWGGIGLLVGAVVEGWFSVITQDWPDTLLAIAMSAVAVVSVAVGGHMENRADS
jgi:hypothetical protein